jgi:hypothetical protein
MQLLVGGRARQRSGTRQKELQAGDVQTKDSIATFGGLRMVVSGSVAYMQSERQVSAFDRGCYLELSRQRAALQRKSSALKKSMSKMPKPEAEEAGRQIEELNARMGKLDVGMKACYLWTTSCGYPYRWSGRARSVRRGDAGKWRR